MKCPAKYLGRWAAFLFLAPCWIGITIWDTLAEGFKAAWSNLKRDLAADIPSIKSDFMKVLRGEPFL